MRYILIYLLFILSQMSYAQSVMSLDEVIAKAISLNYDIQVETLNLNAAELDNSSSGAGMLPRVNLGVGDTYSTNNILQRFANGQEITSPNAAGNQFNTFIQADWLVFDGLRMFYRKDQLELLEEKAKVDLQLKMQELVRQITDQYANLLRLNELIAYAEDIISINIEKEEIAKMRWETGTSSKTEFLQASLALNEQQVNLLNRKIEFRSQRAEINKMMGEAADLEWSPQATNAAAVEEDYAALLEKMKSNNLSLKSSQLQLNAVSKSLKEVKAARLPQINISAAYNFTRVDNTAGFSLFNRSFGPQAGISLIVPIFNAGDINRNVKKAEIQLKQSEVLRMQISNSLNIQLTRLISDLSMTRDIIAIEKETKTKAEEWVNIELERLKNGQSNITEVYIAQTTLENSTQRLADATYRLELLSTELRLLTNAN